MNAKSVAAIARDLETESKDSAKRIARSLFGDVPYGAEQQSKADFLAMLRRNWGDPNYRGALGGYFAPGPDGQPLYHAGRISPDAFMDASAEAGMIPLNWRDGGDALTGPNPMWPANVVPVWKEQPLG